MFRISFKKDNHYAEIVGDAIVILFGTFLLLNNILKINNYYLLLTIFYALYGLTNLGVYYFKKSRNEYSNLLLGVLGIFFAIANHLIDFTSAPRINAIHTLAFGLGVSLIKLKAADFYNDRKNKTWLIIIAHLVLFLLMNILVSLNYTTDYQSNIKLLGFYVFIMGIMNFYETMYITLTRKTVIK